MEDTTLATQTVQRNVSSVGLGLRAIPPSPHVLPLVSSTGGVTWPGVTPVHPDMRALTAPAFQRVAVISREDFAR